MVHYPSSPNPSLTLGITDPNLITILQAVLVEVPGLKFFKDGQWLSFAIEPDGFMVFIGNQLEVSNYKSLNSLTLVFYSPEFYI